MEENKDLVDLVLSDNKAINNEILGRAFALACYREHNHLINHEAVTEFYKILDSIQKGKLSPSKIFHETNDSRFKRSIEGIRYLSAHQYHGKLSSLSLYGLFAISPQNYSAHGAFIKNSALEFKRESGSDNFRDYISRRFLKEASYEIQKDK